MFRESTSLPLGRKWIFSHLSIFFRFLVVPRERFQKYVETLRSYKTSGTNDELLTLRKADGSSALTKDSCQPLAPLHRLEQLCITILGNIKK